jgi:hypothetical protein
MVREADSSKHGVSLDMKEVCHSVLYSVFRPSKNGVFTYSEGVFCYEQKQKKT